MADTPLYEQIYRHIAEEIHSGKLQPQDRVPSEKELAEQFNVSRITSKSALEKLSQAGLIKRLRGKGSFVAKSLPVLAANPPEPEPSGGAGRKAIGFIAPDLSDAFGIRILRRVEQALTAVNYDLLLKFTYNNQQLEEKAISSLVQAGVKGLIVFPVNGELYNSDLLKLVYKQFPLVLVDKYLKGIPASAVYTDNKRASEVLTEYLLNKGHTRVAFISSTVQNTSSIEERLQGFISAHMKKGIGVNQNYCFTELTHNNLEMDFKTQKDKLIAFISRHPGISAYVAAEYPLAILLENILGELNLRAETKEIVCFDAEQTYPSSDYAHILQNEESIGSKAVELLVDQIAGQKTPLHTIIDFSFVPPKNKKSI